jgi:hypothetical protein
MSDLIFAAAFIAMVATPAMVATFGGRKEYNPPSDPQAEPEPSDWNPVRPPKRPSAGIIHPQSMHKAAPGMIISDNATLPMLNGRGMANR